MTRSKVWLWEWVAEGKRRSLEVRESVLEGQPWRMMAHLVDKTVS